MGRRRKGRDISGWVIVDKPAGVGSTDVVNKVRWAFEAKKAGHAGTLDPDATGLLAVALGEATKIVSSITDALKAYDFQVRWGAETSTDDASGEVIATSESRPDETAIRAALDAYRGDIMQVPPSVSAVKVDGQRAYDLAREGATPELKARPLYVDELELTGLRSADDANFHMVCGKGGYVRAIARDLGRDLGCHGHVTALRRIWSGPFDLEQSVPYARIKELARTPEIDDLLLPVEAGLSDLPHCLVSEQAATRIRNGNPAEVLSTEAEFGDLSWAMRDGRPLALGTYEAGRFVPSRVLNLG
ncbi:tRNA pseudouridine(55) synthase TruB [Palleronia caenipelagi]|uniref:tRNA pseudouridine synthase B n=1 Tax=Palleronia caenipelagi TaxID=2489174 RepID=A0A547Q795_9RHOB|nr:tRNA pseudouridine(55) synthase TruB [Palleronia caenipelagi]TRD22244.1 tRNA pseudouridine(55) synthase TruB [Palleronia caenipelagi]